MHHRAEGFDIVDPQQAVQTSTCKSSQTRTSGKQAESGDQAAHTGANSQRG